MIVVINGPCGIGKTSVAWELNARFERAVMLDGDYVGAVHPFEIYDEARITYLYRTIHHLVAYHVEQGAYDNFVINYVFETPESLTELRRLLADLDDEIYAFRLTASDRAIEHRIRKREQESDAELRWYLRRYRELVGIQSEAARRGDMGYLIDTTDLSAEEVADIIWQNLREAIVLAPYDPAWPEQYEAERSKIATVLDGLALEIHHIGSTAVPGLEAKPVIDTMVVLHHLDDAAQCISPLKTIGYSFINYPQNTDRLFFRKGMPRTHHLHIVQRDSQALGDHLDFRDALRADPMLRQRYRELKRALSAQYKHDRARYSKSKGVCILETLTQWRARR